MTSSTREPLPELTAVTDRTGLDRLLSPRSAVVIGASEKKGSIGSWVLRNMQRAFDGDLYAVNPRKDSIHGTVAYHDVSALPEGIDLAIAVVPAAFVVETLEKCAERGVGGVAVLTAGFSESSGAGTQLQRQVADVVARTGIRVVGPNCIGFMNVHGGVMANFALYPEQPMPPAGPVALVSQSGGFGSYITMKSLLAGLRLGWFVSTGNEVDVNVSQVLRHLVESDDVRVLLACVETVRDPDAFVEAAKRADELDKPIVLLKAGRSEAAAQAVLSHTASVVGSADVLDAVCAQYGVIVVDSMEELLDLGMIFQNGRRARGSRLGIMTSSGGAGVLMVDCAVAEGLVVPPIPQDEAARIEAYMPQPFYGDVRNPVDTTAQITGDPGRFKPVLDSVLGSSVVDVFTTVTWAFPGPMNDAIITSYQESDKPFALLSTAWMDQFQEAGLPTYTDPQRAIHALGVLARYSGRRRKRPVAALLDATPRPPVRTGGTGHLLESEAKQVIAAYDIPTTREAVVSTADEAVAYARDLGAEVALKVMSYELPHKTEYGALRLGLRGDEQVRDAYGEMLREVAERAPEAAIEGVLVQEMVPARVELTCGMHHDSDFGAMVSVGLGGVLVEVIAQTALLRPPFDRDDAREAIAGLAGGRLVSARRGLTPQEVDAVAGIVTAVGRLALDHPEVREIDVNPIRVSDGRAIAADALIVLGEVPGTGAA